MKKTQIIIFLIISIFTVTSCKFGKNEEKPEEVLTDLQSIINADTLRVGTMYGSTSYFNYRDETMGYDFEMVEALAKYFHVNLKIVIAKNETELAIMLQQGDVDLVANNFIETKEYKKLFNFVLPQPMSYQVLVQRIGSYMVSDVTQLTGKTVYVVSNSIFQKRINALNDEIGGKINIIYANDSLTNDDLIEMVAQKQIDYTIAYHNVAILHKSYSKNIDCRMPVGFSQRNGWLIRKGSFKLKMAIENWTKLPSTENLQAKLYEKYWEKSLYFSARKVKIPKGAISPYDKIFQKYAPQIGWDWRLLAALAYHESRFDSAEISWAGAVGIMQLMPRTAYNFGLDSTTIFNPDKNIEAGVQYIKSLSMNFRKVENKDERIKFILAGYNSGPAHIFDAMALAEKYGRNPYIWYNQVEYFLLRKSEPEFYNDPVVKYGKFGGKETVRYVQNTLETYEKYLGRK